MGGLSLGWNLKSESQVDVPATWTRLLNYQELGRSRGMTVPPDESAVPRLSDPGRVLFQIRRNFIVFIGIGNNRRLTITFQNMVSCRNYLEQNQNWQVVSLSNTKLELNSEKTIMQNQKSETGWKIFDQFSLSEWKCGRKPLKLCKSRAISCNYNSSELENFN